MDTNKATQGAAEADSAKPDEANNQSEPLPEPVRFVRDFTGSFNEVTVHYQSIAGETRTLDDKAKPVASFFSIAYVKKEVEDVSRRPVTFFFNGGPTSPAHWLHMGAFGPRRIVVPSDAQHAGAPPYELIDNPGSPLDVSDLVFIDPVGTGYSRPLGGKQTKDYFGLLEDARSVADFIEAWITQHRRWNSPKYLAGESYGTVRASLVAEHLTARSTALNGVVLISAVQDYQNCRPKSEDGGVLSYTSFLPTYAAIAWYHGKVERQGRSLATFLDEVCEFANNEYSLALIANTRLPKEQRARVVARIAAYTGLRETYIEQSKLRLPVARFFKELLRDRGLVVGRLDGRYTGIEAEHAGETCEADPSNYGVSSAFNAAINTHLHELGVRMDRPYLLNKFIETWNWQLEDKPANGGGYVNVVPYLGRAMRRNKDLRVLVASGYYDLATPYFGAVNALSQDGIVQDRLSYTYYEVGHMIFLHEPSLVKFLEDVRGFIQAGGRQARSDMR